MIHTVKQAVLGAAGNLGLFSLLLQSAWRRRRLLVLCYHGVSLDDEHEWNPLLYISPRRFREHLQLLDKLGCAVLPLGDALHRLRDGSLPPRSVTVTFDDGFHDFFCHSAPLLAEFGFPATLYLTTYYCQHDLGVFDPMVPYLLWKGRKRRLHWPAMQLDTLLETEESRAQADRSIKNFAAANGLTAVDKEELVEELASRTNVDYDEIRQRRILRLMRPDEIRHVAAAGVDIQLHTHRHRVSRDRLLFDREIDENRERITHYTGAQELNHFCYPGGYHIRPFDQWLREKGMVSAATCQPGIVSRRTDSMRLPRFVPTTLTSDADLASWISGFATLLPVRRAEMSDTQLLEGSQTSLVSLNTAVSGYSLHRSVSAGNRDNRT
jgi:peptidoglycan/xylan/chitin deacetylase (PgdA/CDA1 family)